MGTELLICLLIWRVNVISLHYISSMVVWDLLESANKCSLFFCEFTVTLLREILASWKGMLKSPFLLKIVKQAVGLLIGVFVVIAHNSNLCKRSLKDLQSVHVVICYVCCILWYRGKAEPRFNPKFAFMHRSKWELIICYNRTQL